MWDDNETNIALFGHARIAKTISALIREERLSPLTMGVHGDWGAGKSSVLQLVEQELKDDDDVLCLRFNGWLFQGFDDTKVTTMEAIVGALRDRRPQSEKVKEKVGEMFARHCQRKVARSEFSTDDRELGRHELTPLGERGGTVELEIVS